jgi:hypothetical protein
MAKQIKGSKIVFINGEGHEIYVDRAKECIQEIESFVNSVNKQ